MYSCTVDQHCSTNNAPYFIFNIHAVTALTTYLTVAPTKAVCESVHTATLLVEQQEIGKQLLQLDRNHSHLSTDRDYIDVLNSQRAAMTTIKLQWNQPPSEQKPTGPK